MPLVDKQRYGGHGNLMSLRLSRPVQKDCEGDDLDDPKFDAVNDPVRVETSSTHTISFPAARKTVTYLYSDFFTRWSQPADPKISKSRKFRKSGFLE